jgi:hypothetical protein
MKINKAYQTLEGLLSKNEKKSDRRIYQELLGALHSLEERGLSGDQLRSIEEALDQLLLPEGGAIAKGLRKRRNQFMKHIRETLSLIPEGHYMEQGLGFGVVFGVLIGSALQGVGVIPDGMAGTGFGMAIGLIVAYGIASHLDIEAKKENRVLVTRSK